MGQFSDAFNKKAEAVFCGAAGGMTKGFLAGTFATVAALSLTGLGVALFPVSFGLAIAGGLVAKEASKKALPEDHWLNKGHQ